MSAAVRGGPAATSRAARAALVASVAERVALAEGEALECVALYGSMARGDDGPHSDVELLASVRGRDDHRVDEWLAPACKVKLHRYGTSRLRALAGTAGPEWPLERGKWLQLVLVRGSAWVLEAVRAWSDAVSDGALREAARGLLVSELHELVGKARNAAHAGRRGVLPGVALRMAEQSALWLALVRRAHFTSRHLMLAEALPLAGGRAGLEGLLGRALEGELAGDDALALAVERAWDDLVTLADDALDLEACHATTLPEAP